MAQGLLSLTFNLFDMSKKDFLSKEYKLKIGGNIRKWRNLKGVKQKELAVLLEVSESAISNIENNITDITLSQLEDISQGLDISIEQLFTDPQETIAAQPVQNGIKEKNAQPIYEKELLNAVINSMQKKDEQLQTIMQNVLQTMTVLMGGGGNRESVTK